MDEEESLIKRLAINESMGKTRISVHMQFVRATSNRTEADRMFRRAYLPQNWGPIEPMDRYFTRKNPTTERDPMIFFTSDLHLGHANVIRHCNRPFATVEEMDEVLIRNWNQKIKANDTVYILGDLMFRNQIPPDEYLKRLRGKKHLITGNHDRDWVKKCQLEDYFESVNRLDYISDGRHQMTLCHFPMMSWPHNTRAYMVFGHIHNNTDAEYWPLICRSELMLNAGVDINGFMPVTFDEMVVNNRKHKEMSLTLDCEKEEET